LADNSGGPHNKGAIGRLIKTTSRLV